MDYQPNPTLDEALHKTVQERVYFSDLKETERAVLLQEVIREHTDPDGNLYKTLGGEATRAFLQSINGYLYLGARKVIVYNSPRAYFSTTDAVHSFLAGKNIGKLAQSVLNSNLQPSTVIIGNVFTEVARVKNRYWMPGVTYPGRFNARKMRAQLQDIFETQEDVDENTYQAVLEDSSSAQEYISAGTHPVKVLAMMLKNDVKTHHFPNNDGLLDIKDIQAEADMERVEERVTAIEDVLQLPFELLHDKQHAAIAIRFGLDGSGKSHTYQEVGDALHISRQRAEQLCSEALLILRDPEAYYEKMIEKGYFSPYTVRYILHSAGIDSGIMKKLTLPSLDKARSSRYFDLLTLDKSLLSAIWEGLSDGNKSILQLLLGYEEKVYTIGELRLLFRKDVREKVRRIDYTLRTAFERKYGYNLFSPTKPLQVASKPIAS